MISLLLFIWNQNPILFDAGNFTINWWVIYVILLFLLLNVYLYETTKEKKDEIDDYIKKYHNKEWYFSWGGKKPTNKKSKLSHKKRDKNSIPQYTLLLAGVIIFSRLVYCKRRLHDVGAFFQSFNTECFQFHIQIHWYSLCWLIGLVGAFFTVKWLYNKQQIPAKIFDSLFIYCFLGILIGARIGHCLFYEPNYFFWEGHITEMLIPIRTHADGTTEFTGFSGLASHGGTIGLMVALWLYCKNNFINIWYVLDNIAIATGLTACFIRIGNFMNSEIVGKITTLDNTPWAIWFKRIDPLEVYRHPGQLYEAIAYFILYIVSISLFRFFPNKIGSGFYFGICLTYIFTFRFFIEYLKEVQESFEQDMIFDMGQILSIPFIIVGIACIKGNTWMKKLGAQ